MTDVHATYCHDSCIDCLPENYICDEIDSLSANSSDSSSFVTHVDPTLALKPLPDSLKYAFLGPNETFSMIVACDDQEGKLLKLLRETKRSYGGL